MSNIKITLPIDDFIPEILRKIKNKQNLVITAAPGAGKTTRLPPALLNSVVGKILVLEPRRMAAIAAAHRIAEENNWRLGNEIGYQVRFASKTSPQTRLIFMTEALLARQMIHDPELQGVSIVILDEFHERSLYVDLTLGLLRELQQLGRDIQLIVMSATLEAEKISAYLGQAEVVSVPGKLYPLEIHYQKAQQLLKTQSQFYENLLHLIKDAQSLTDKDLLVFLPGVGEIERGKDFLSSWAESQKIELLPLHGSLPLEIQRKTLQKSSRQRVILSTNIAESSVTIDGVNTVIDSGLAKVMRLDMRTGFSRLELSRISLSSAIQRSGRAARQFPGVTYRMWNRTDELSFGKSEVPEILRSDLSESLLFLAAQGVRDFENFSWFEKPSGLSLERAVNILKTNEALNETNELTEMGRKILHFPLSIRLARLLIAGIETSQAELAAKVSALLQERDILRKESIGTFLGGNESECDLTARIDILNQFLNKDSAREGHFQTLQTVAQSYQQILQLAKQIPQQSISVSNNHEALQLLLISAYGDRLCRRRKNSDRGLMVGGRGVKLSADSLVKKSEFFISLNGVEGNSDSETMVSLASGIEKEFLLKTFASKILKKKEIIFDEEKLQFYQQEYKSLWDLPLEEPSFFLATPAQVAEKLPEILAHSWQNTLNHNKNLNLWWQKIVFLRAQQEHLNSDTKNELQAIFDGNFLKKSLRIEALTLACLGESKMADVLKKDLVYFFEGVLPENLRHILQIELPSQIKMPSGSLLDIHYPSDKAPFLEVRIQEVFGWSVTPKVLFHKIAIVLHLLGPNYRPVQITSNLESFWQNGYPEARKELRIRYPKHQWPLDPADGVAEAKGRRRT